MPKLSCLYVGRAHSALSLFAVFAGLCAAEARSQAAGPQPAAPSIDEYLQYGEFPLAVEQARRGHNPAERDADFVAIAKGKASAGMLAASYTTLAMVDDDRARTAAIEQVQSASLGHRGGGVQADFDTLIDLIKSTVAPNSWDDVGGAGAIAPFPTGVYVDAAGLLRRPAADSAGRLASLRTASNPVSAVSDAAGPPAHSPRHSARRKSTLRKISLNRLERDVQLRLAAKQPLDDEMLVLAGLEQVRYLLVYPEERDVVLAGPADDWTVDREGRVVSASSGRPVVRLDDLVVLLRRMSDPAAGVFGCAITPTQDGLAKARAFAEQSKGQPIQPGRRRQWLEDLRSRLGPQTIEVFGLDPRSRAAHVLVEADYRMKLVGIGLEEGTLGVPSYLEMLKAPRGAPPPAMDVLRWWFALDSDALVATAERDAFELRGQTVHVLSENELLTEQGQRVHTGASEPLNLEFAHNFTRHFAALAAKYPVYAELQNVFDLAIVAALLRSEGLAERAGWHMLCFGDPAAFPVAAGPAPKTVDTVINHRVIRDDLFVAAVSGGVSVDLKSIAGGRPIPVDPSGRLASQRGSATAAAGDRTQWWWD